VSMTPTDEQMASDLALVFGYAHRLDEDGVCTRCGFDGAEWHFWKHHTYEGRASDAKSPPCNGEQP
jgi:hypothetical protein